MAALLDKKTVSLYIDGVLAGTKSFDGTYQQPRPPSGRWSLFPEEAQGGLKIGATSVLANTRAFDCDELSIYNRVLTPADIATRFIAGRPATSVADQIYTHQELIKKQVSRDRIKIEIPRASYGYFPADKSIPLTITVPSDVAIPYPLKVTVALSGENAKAIFQAEKFISQKQDSVSGLVWEIPFAAARGLYDLRVALTDARGASVVTTTFPLAATVAIPPVGERPASSPLGGHQIFSRHNETLALGARTERNIPYIPKNADGSPNFTTLDRSVDIALSTGIDLMLCIQPYYDPPGSRSENIPTWENWARAIVDRYKGRVKYWEILNEPNAHNISPAQYVGYLKTAHAIIRELDPAAKVVGLCGVTTYPEWTDDVLAAGGGGYFDILAFHNYIGSSPISAWRTQRKIERTRAIMLKHMGKEVPMWNTESGIHQPRRIDGHSLTDDELLERYPRGSRQADGIVLVPADAITMATEKVGACWQTQSILLDCGLGVERWFMLMGSSVFYPHGGASKGTPSLKGVAYAALSSVVSTMKSAKLIPLSVSSSAGVLITHLDAHNTVALFADTPATRSFSVRRNGTYRGMDYLGNPLSWEARDNLLTVSFGMEPVYIFDVSDDFREAPFLGISDVPALVSPGEQTAGAVTVTNLYSTPLSAELAITSPQSTVTHDRAISLKPGEKTTVPFQLKAGPLKRGEHVLTVRLSRQREEIASFEQTFTSEGVARGIPRVSQAIRLDGDSADWDGIPAETADTSARVVIGRPPVGYYDPATWQGPSDLSFSVKTAWHPDRGIYFLLTVTDDVVKTVPAEKLDRGFLQDALEFFFDGRPLHEQAPVYSFGAEQHLIVPAVGATASPCLHKSWARYGDSVEIESVGKKTASGYVIEGLVRPKPGAPFKLVAGTRIGMDFTLDDAGEAPMTRKTQMALHGTSNNNTDTSGFGRYYLMDQTAAATLNLLRNPELQAAPDGSLPGWVFQDGSKAATGKETKSGVKEIDGVRALWMSVPEGVQAQGLWIQTVPVKPEHGYAVSFRVKGDLAGTAKWCNAGGGVYFLGDQGQWLGFERIATQPPSGEWGTYGARVLAPAGATQLGFRFQASANNLQGSLDFFCTDMVVSEEPAAR